MLANALALTALTLLTDNAPEPLRLASPGLARVNLEPEAIESYVIHLQQELIAGGVKVVDPAQMLDLLTPEQQNDLIGCAVTSRSCSSGLANALGVDGTVIGRVVRQENNYTVELEVTSPTGASLTTFTKQVDSEHALLDALKEASEKMSEELTHALHKGRVKPKLDVAVVAAKRRFYTEDMAVRRTARIPFLGGIVLAAGGGLLLALSKNDFDSLEGAGARQGLFASLAAARSTAKEGSAEQTVGLVLVSVGAAAAVTGAVMYAIGRPPPASTVTLIPTGNGMALTGVFP